MNQSLWPIAIVEGIVCAYLPVGLADTITTPEPAVAAAAAEPAKVTTTTTTSRWPTREEVRAAVERGAEKAAAAGKRAAEAAKRELRRFEREHPQATRPSTTTITTGDPKAPLVIRQHGASQP
jgi:hypothetical protein